MLWFIVRTVLSQDNCSSTGTLISIGATITTNNTILQSPETRLPVSFWRISAPSGTTISLEFICEFNVPSTGGICRYGVSIYSNDATGFNDNFCGVMPSEPVDTGSNDLTVQWTQLSSTWKFFVKILFLPRSGSSNASVECSTNQGITAIEDAVIVHSSSSSLSSSTNTSHQQVSYGVSVNDGYHMYVEFICEFYIEGMGGNCSNPLTITSDQIDGFKRELCGSNPPPPFYVGSKSIQIAYRTDYAGQRFEFVMKITEVAPFSDTTVSDSTDVYASGAVTKATATAAAVTTTTATTITTTTATAVTRWDIIAPISAAVFSLSLLAIWRIFIRG